MSDFEQKALNLLKEISCKLDALKTTFPTDGGETIVVTHPPRSTNVNWGKTIITTTPTLIRPSNPQRLSVSIVNSGAATVYLADDSIVTTNTGTEPGYELLANGEFNTETFVGDIYGVVAAGSVTITYWEEVE